MILSTSGTQSEEFTGGVCDEMHAFIIFFFFELWTNSCHDRSFGLHLRLEAGEIPSCLRPPYFFLSAVSLDGMAWRGMALE
jgi:hypothetical protein